MERWVGGRLIAYQERSNTVTELVPQVLHDTLDPVPHAPVITDGDIAS